jgi:hypothetical protein
LSACSTKEEIVVQEEPAFSDDVINTSTYTDEKAEVEDEIELGLLQSQYPGMDLEAMGGYMEENNLEYQEELIGFLDDIYENGESTLTSNYYANESSFPVEFLCSKCSKNKASR